MAAAAVVIPISNREAHVYRTDYTVRAERLGTYLYVFTSVGPVRRITRVPADVSNRILTQTRKYVYACTYIQVYYVGIYVRCYIINNEI